MYEKIVVKKCDRSVHFMHNCLSFRIGLNINSSVSVARVIVLSTVFCAWNTPYLAISLCKKIFTQNVCRGYKAKLPFLFSRQTGLDHISY